jgi:hypothetical protein
MEVRCPPGYDVKGIFDIKSTGKTVIHLKPKPKKNEKDP